MSNTTFDGIASGSGTGVDPHYKGSYLDSTLLTTAHPTASAGDWAYVNPVGGPPIQWTWDNNEVSPGWVNTGISGLGDFVGPAGAVTNNIVTFYDNTGKIGKDSGVAVGSVVVGPASAIADHIPQFSGGTGKLLKDGLAVSSIISATGTNGSIPTELAVYNAVSVKGNVNGPGSAVDGNIVLFDGTTGKLIKDGLSVVTSIGATGFDTNIATEKAVRTAISAIPAGGDVTGPGSSTDGHVPQFDGATGKLLKDGLNVSTIISSGSLNTDLPTALAVYNKLTTIPHSSLTELDYGSSEHTGFQKATYVSVSSPTVNDDGANTSGNGEFAVGTYWYNSSIMDLFVCKDNSTGAAIWCTISSGNVRFLRTTDDIVNIINNGGNYKSYLLDIGTHNISTSILPPTGTIIRGVQRAGTIIKLRDGTGSGIPIIRIGNLISSVAIETLTITHGIGWNSYTDGVSGINMEGSSGAIRVQNINAITGGIGIYVKGTKNVEVSGCYVKSGYHGITAATSTDIFIHHNIVEDSGYVMLSIESNPSNVIVSDNVVKVTQNSATVLNRRKLTLADITGFQLFDIVTQGSVTGQICRVDGSNIEVWLNGTTDFTTTSITGANGGSTTVTVVGNATTHICFSSDGNFSTSTTALTPIGYNIVRGNDFINVDGIICSINGDGIIFEGNSLTLVSNNSIYNPMAITGSYNRISNNRIYRSGVCGSGITLDTCFENVISDNSFYTMGSSGVGIYIAKFLSGSTINRSAKHDIVNNKFYTFLSFTTTSGTGTLPTSGSTIFSSIGGLARVLRTSGSNPTPTIIIYSQNGLFRNGNTVRTSTWSGTIGTVTPCRNTISFASDSSASDCYVAGNVISSGYVDNFTDVNGISLNGNGSHTVYDNLIFNCTGTGISSADGNSNKINENILQFCTSYGINVISSNNTRVKGNRIVGAGFISGSSLSAIAFGSGSGNSAMNNKVDPGYYDITLTGVSGTFLVAEGFSQSSGSAGVIVNVAGSVITVRMTTEELFAIGSTCTGSVSTATGTASTIVAKKYVGYGVRFDDTNDFNADSNDVTGTINGIYINNSTTAFVGGNLSHNTVIDCTTGMTANNISKVSAIGNRTSSITNGSFLLTGTNSNVSMTTNIIPANTSGTNISFSDTTSNCVFSNNDVAGTISFGTNETNKINNNTGILDQNIIISKAGNYSLLTTDSYKTFNVSAAATITLPTLSTALIGYVVRIVSTTTSQVTVQAGASNYIDVSTAAGTIYTTDKYASLTLQAISATEWAITNANKSWTTT